MLKGLKMMHHIIQNFIIMGGATPIHLLEVPSLLFY